MPAESSGEIEDFDVVEVDAIARKNGVQAGDVGAFGLGQFIDVALKQINVFVFAMP